jgi:hypothetical protein
MAKQPEPTTGVTATTSIDAFGGAAGEQRCRRVVVERRPRGLANLRCLKRDH